MTMNAKSSSLARSSSCELFLALVLAATAAACGSRPPENPKDYVATIVAWHDARDSAFRNGSDSPVPKNRRDELLPLGYFPVDPEYKTGAGLTPSNEKAEMQVPTSTGTVRRMRRVGALEFSVKGHPLKLTAFVEVGARDVDHLFVPFNDLTSGAETYPGGRYLDLDRNSTGIYEMDFIRAYFPSCYYSPTYECPIPPAENRLKVPIKAGERFKTQQ
jgi:uncharacterized protein (DUF1684 family)